MTPGEVVTALMSACERRDLDAACALVTDDIEYDNVPIGKVFGPGGVHKVLSGGVMAEASEIEWRVLAQTADGDTVMNERIDRFRVGERWIEIPIAAVFRIRDGRICLWRDYFDLETYRKQR
jgi:limonene-1,2-epoxide hydrolase